MKKDFRYFSILPRAKILRHRIPKNGDKNYYNCEHKTEKFD